MKSKGTVEKSLRQRALEYLAKREYSVKELEQKLKIYADEADDIAMLLHDFKVRGWLSDARFAQQIVQARKRKFGAGKIAHELREKGVADDLVTEAVTELKLSEFEYANVAWHRKFSKTAQTREEWAKQARFLQSRGFGFETIKKVLNSKFDDDN